MNKLHLQFNIKFLNGGIFGQRTIKIKIVLSFELEEKNEI